MPFPTRTCGALGLALLVAAFPVSAPAAEPGLDENVFVFGGPFTTGHFEDTFLVWEDHYESNFFAGAGYQRFLYSYGSFKLGVEAGAGVRFGAGEPVSAEVWGGAVARLTTFSLGGLDISPSITFGLSAVTDTIGVETTRAEANAAKTGLLYYLGPEIAISSAEHPEWEGFVRVQHRSGGYGTITNLDGSNAATVGIRYRF